jgi:hypothetical protein
MCESFTPHFPVRYERSQMLDGNASSISLWKNLVTFKHFNQKGSGILEIHIIRHTESRQLRCKFFVVYITKLSVLVCQII